MATLNRLPDDAASRTSVAGSSPWPLEIDQHVGLRDLDLASGDENRSQPELIERAVDDHQRRTLLPRPFRAQLGEQYVTQDWTTMNARCSWRLWLEKMAISVTIGLIVMVARSTSSHRSSCSVMEKSATSRILKPWDLARSVMYVFHAAGAAHFGFIRHGHRHPFAGVGTCRGE
jgi:ABC-type lipoprotein release transport system permease subunit